jgi:hypothetical protein
MHGLYVAKSQKKIKESSIFRGIIGWLFGLLCYFSRLSLKKIKEYVFGRK